MTIRNFTGAFRIIFLSALALPFFSCTRLVTKSELREHIKYLASDSLRGRLTGSAGDSLAADYIRRNLYSSGFTPVNEDGFQRFRVTKRIVEGRNNRLSINGTSYLPDKDFMPLAFTSQDSLEAAVVFTGYGFNFKSDSLEWNDYRNIDVKGKWVMMLRADPEPDNNSSLYLPFSADRDKALTAKDLGAAGILLVAGKNSDPQDAFEPLGTEGFSAGVPAFRIKRSMADIILSSTGKSIDALERELIKNRKSVTIETGSIVKARAELVRETAGTRNVIMKLQGEDPKLAKEYVVIGAHFDHLGMGGKGSSSRAVDTVAVHPGADDNASGVAMMLELAEKFSKTKASHKRSIVCVAFTGEEEGLLGSKHYVDDPGIDLSRVNSMINLDMLGRLNESNILQISGTGTAKGLRKMIQSVSDTSVIKLALSDEGFGPSDHSSFYGKNIPVLFYFTGAHTDYHTPFDTYDKINYEGMLRISDLIFNVAENLANSDTTLHFTEAGPKTAPARRMKGVTLGIMPDFAGA
ncbi:MAG TPA: M20/M25/M40 family metallo-hydrolase, partial [Bacteroidales bacterium]|nr:M20/M25/M40 family metallo-hydrolase [Bacteroidales bacterium]